MKPSIKMTALILFVGLSLQACGATPILHAAKNKASTMLWGEDVNLIERNYAAADYIIQQAKSYIGQYELIQVQHLTSLDHPKLRSDFDSIVPLQVGERLMQLGYRVDLSDVSQSADASYHANQGQSADHYLTGTYAKLSPGLQLNLRIVNRRTGNVIGSFSYQLPFNSDIEKLAEPKAQIFLMEP